MTSPIQRIQIDRAGAAQPFEQLEQQIAALIQAGELQAGDRLPTVRQLAADLGLAANTVARVYRDLETAGLLDTRGRSGTFVQGDQVARQAGEAATDFAARMRALGIAPGAALELARQALRA